MFYQRKLAANAILGQQFAVAEGRGVREVRVAEHRVIRAAF